MMAFLRTIGKCFPMRYKNNSTMEGLRQLAFPHLDMDKKDQRYRHEVFHIQVWTHLWKILIYPYPSVEAFPESDKFSSSSP